jgi:hypothetical protein
MLFDAQEVFATFLIENRDFNEADVQAECRRLFQRQQAIADVLDGKLPPDVLLDMVQDQGIEASEYVDCVQDNLSLFEGTMP